MNFEESVFGHWIGGRRLTQQQEAEVSRWQTPDQEAYSPKRLQEWLAGRYCAKRAALKAGVILEELPTLPSRDPKWPDGLKGSISHTKNFVISIVSKKARGLGVDCEELMPPGKAVDLFPHFGRREEEGMLALNPSFFGTLTFSAKESLYKAVAPLSGEFFDFKDAFVKAHGKGNFTIELQSARRNVRKFNGSYAGKYTLVGNTLVTSVSIF